MQALIARNEPSLNIPPAQMLELPIPRPKDTFTIPVLNVRDINMGLDLGLIINWESLLQKIAQDTAIGHLGQPDNLHNVSHKITAIVNEGDDWYVTVKPLDTPAGNVLSKLLNAKLAHPTVWGDGMGKEFHVGTVSFA